MHESESAAGQAWLTRSEVELELARIALKVMRAAPAAFPDTANASLTGAAGAALPELCAALLGRTSPPSTGRSSSAACRNSRAAWRPAAPARGILG